jgi:hypothetical protein
MVSKRALFVAMVVLILGKFWVVSAQALTEMCTSDQQEGLLRCQVSCAAYQDPVLPIRQHFHEFLHPLPCGGCTFEEVDNVPTHTGQSASFIAGTEGDSTDLYSIMFGTKEERALILEREERERKARIADLCKELPVLKCDELKGAGL